MPLRIVRNDITRMNTEAIVNTANKNPVVGPGCDTAVYKAAGFDRLLEYRKKNIGEVKTGEAFITPAFNLNARYIIHAVSPLFMNNEDDENLLRSCYQNSLKIAKENKIASISFPLIATGNFGYPKEEGMRIAVDEINRFLLYNEMDITLVVFDDHATELGKSIFPDLEAYIDSRYVEQKEEILFSGYDNAVSDRVYFASAPAAAPKEKKPKHRILESFFPEKKKASKEFDFYVDEDRISERIKHITDTFSKYLIYLIDSKGYEYSDVYKRAIVDKKVFSKIKNNPNYHPQKITALCLCIGAMLNLDESKDLLARAGYAFSPCSKTDIIFQYFIENEIYDMIELDIQLEAHGLACIIE